jgi:sodium/proline symporter
MTDQSVIVAAFGFYVALMFGIGGAAYLRTQDLADYLLGGRRISAFAGALSAGASDMSGWLLLGLPGLAYVSGSEGIYVALGLLTGTYLNWRFVAQRLRERSVELGNALTIPGYLERAFDDRSHILRFVAAVTILGFFLFYTSAGLVAGGKLFEAVFGLPYGYAVVGSAAIVLVYTSVGGFLAVVWTDVIQALLMLAALLMVAAMALSNNMENAVITEVLARVNLPAVGSIAAISALAWGLGYMGQPHILVRFMAIDRPSQIPRARRIAVTWTALSLVGAVAVGIAGSMTAGLELTDGDAEKVFIALIGALLHPAVAGVCLAAILAAIMSTADSQLLVASSALTEDLLGPRVRKPLTARATLLFSRCTVILISALATLIALTPTAGVLNLVAYAWAGFGASLGPCIVLSLYWPRMTRGGALAGIVAGACGIVGWTELEGGLFDLYELLPAFLFSVFAIIVVSLAGRDPGSKTAAGPTS